MNLRGVAYSSHCVFLTADRAYSTWLQNTKLVATAAAAKLITESKYLINAQPERALQ